MIVPSSTTRSCPTQQAKRMRPARGGLCPAEAGDLESFIERGSFALRSAVPTQQLGKVG
jgi:hypothetical protein